MCVGDSLDSLPHSSTCCQTHTHALTCEGLGARQGRPLPDRAPCGERQLCAGPRSVARDAAGEGVLRVRPPQDVHTGVARGHVADLADTGITPRARQGLCLNFICAQNKSRSSDAPSIKMCATRATSHAGKAKSAILACSAQENISRPVWIHPPCPQFAGVDARLHRSLPHLDPAGWRVLFQSSGGGDAYNTQARCPGTADTNS